MGKVQVERDDLLWFKAEAAKILCKYDYKNGIEEFLCVNK